ncbi:MAG: arginine deiminase family protein [Saprospiraceae bacterium]
MINVSSEIGTLRKVIVHRPDEGIDRISPKRAEELLFDDIVYLPKMLEEHQIFTDVLKMFLGDDNVLEVEDLLEEALEYDMEKRFIIINKISDFEELPQRDRNLLFNLSSKDLKEVLITGYYEEEDAFLFDPIPNFLFTRDIAVTINDHVLITKAAKEARQRENLLTRFIFWAHPMFTDLQKEGKVINLNEVDLFPPSRKGEQVSVEGGDVMIINKDYLLIGCSERSTAHGIKLLKDVLFKKDIVKNVAQINLTKARSWMHIDTVFTHIKSNHFAAFKPLVIDGVAAYVEVYRQGTDEVTTYSTVAEFLKAEINPDMEFILSGNGESPYDEREQWTDSCNLVMIKEGVGLAYDRNYKTAEAFEEKGYNVISAEKLLKDFKKGKITPDEVENTIIALPSSELSRARGGSHCMTCPILRD